jgi:hypothetical protein
MTDCFPALRWRAKRYSQPRRKAKLSNTEGRNRSLAVNCDRFLVHLILMWTES